MSPLNRKKLNTLRQKLDLIDNDLLKIIKEDLFFLIEKH